MLTPGGGSAPGFMAPAPTDRVEMSVEQHLEAVLAKWRVTPPTEQDLQLFQQFNMGVQAIMAGDQGEVGNDVEGEGEDQTGGDAASMRSPEQDYGTQAGAEPIPGYAD